MPSATLRTNPALWKKLVAKVKKGAKGGKPGQWSARKAQLAVLLYKQSGQGYKSRKQKDNKLAKWTRQQWTTSTGQASRGKLRYLPKKAWAKLSKSQISATNRAKRLSRTQYSKQPRDVAKITKRFRQ
jgi:hypothetical protein